MYKLRRPCAVVMCLCALLLLSACGKKDVAPAPASPVIIVPAPGQENVPQNSGEVPANASPRQLTAQEQYDLNIFLSNFAEQRFEGLTNFEDGFSAAVDFMHIYSKIHEPSNITYSKLPNGRTYECISLETANLIFERFFGCSADASLASGYAKTAYDGDIVYGMFFNGSFCFEPADGESYNRIAVADSVSLAPDGAMNVEFTVYELEISRYFDENGINPEYYAINPADAAVNPGLKTVEKGSACVYPCGSGSRDTYRLSFYSVSPAA